MRNFIKEKLADLKASNGGFTAKGKYLSRAEVFHTFIPSLILALLNMKAVFTGLMALVSSGSKLTGHLGDFKKNVGYGIAGFGVGELLQYIAQVII